MLPQTPEVQSVLQAAEEPEQHREEQVGAGRSTRQHLQRAAAAHGSARRLALLNKLQRGHNEGFHTCCDPAPHCSGCSS